MGFGSGFSGKGGGGLKIVSGSAGQGLRFHTSRRVVGTDELTFRPGEGFNVSGNIQHSGNIEPETDNAHSLGRTGKGYAVVSIDNLQANNVFAGDLHMKNERATSPVNVLNWLWKRLKISHLISRIFDVLTPFLFLAKITILHRTPTLNALYA